jgi:predicted site-specific integrase-resolvase
MSSAMQRKAPAPIAPERPVSIGGLAHYLGVPRQRIYNLVRKGAIKTETMSSGKVIMPSEAARVIDAATKIDTHKGSSRVVFDFV